MGWSGGSEMMDRMIRVIENPLYDFDSATKIDLYGELIEVFEDQDCDTLYESLGQSMFFDIAYNERYPQEDEDD